MSYSAVSWNLYTELRKPLSSLETKFNIVQAQPKLSMVVEPFDPLEQAYQDDNSCNTYEDHSQHGQLRRSRPVTATSQRSRSTKCSTAGEEGDSVIYKLHQTKSNYGEITLTGVTKFVWDTHTMRYVKCRPDSLRANSAPAHTSTISLHLQKLFKATHESSPERRLNKPRPHTSYERNKETRDKDILLDEERLEVDSTPNNINNNMTELAKQPVPLSFDQATQVNKVINVTGEPVHSVKPIVSETNPVVFNKTYEPKVYTPSHTMRRPEGFKVHQEKAETVGLCGRKTPITRLGIASDGVMENSDNELTYEEVVSLAPKITSGFTKNRGNSACSPVQTDVSEEQSADEIININEGTDFLPAEDDAEALDASPPEKLPARVKVKKSSKFCFTTPVRPEVKRVKTPTVPAVVRASIIRQCSMPSYTIIPPNPDQSSTEPPTQHDKPQKQVQERIKTPKGKLLSKPVYQSVFQKTGKAPIPTITPNGPPGSKVFLKFALPKDTLLSNKNVKQQKSLGMRTVKSAPSSKSYTSQQQYKLGDGSQENEMADFNSVQNVGKSVKLSQRRTSAATQRSSLSIARSNSSELPSTLKRMSSHNVTARHVDVSIPTAGEALSVVSSNSFTMTDEFSNHSCDLDDVRSDASELLAPTPPTPIPEVEGVQAMKERIHQNLLKTIDDTNQFLSNMETKRRNKAPQIVYSDDEILDDEVNVPVFGDVPVGSYVLTDQSHLPKYIIDSTQVVITPTKPTLLDQPETEPGHS